MKKIYIAIVLAFVLMLSLGCVAAEDTKAPTVTKTSPNNGQKNVELDKTVAVVFSEKVNYGNKNICIKNVKTGKVKAATLTKSGNIIWINPVSNLYGNTQYKVEIHTGSVTDLVGNKVAVKSFTFITRPYKYASHTLTKYKWQISTNADGNYNSYENNYVRVKLGDGYTNGYVYGYNYVEGKYQYAAVGAQKVKVTALKSSVIINKIYITSIGYPSYKYYYNTYYSPNNKWITPGKYKSFEKFVIYYKVRY
jgi:methionine-rich copper-binding protein CopC